jgi:gamma-glutamyl:cysteine ligase YbdK (ATP-grasp superfamily)
MDGSLVDFRAGMHVPAEQMAHGLLIELSDDADELGCGAMLDGLRDLLDGRTGAHRQREEYQRLGDLRAVVDEIVESSRP